MHGKLYKNVLKLAIILFALLLLCCKKDLHAAEKSAEPASCQMSEKCLVLLAYGVLSNDELDIPFGGSCKDIASDSLVNFLKSQKAVFNDSKNDSINAKELIRQIEEKSKKSNECKMSDCITLISYGLLSEKEIDIPFDGVCKGIVSDTITDSLSKYLNAQKSMFKRWQRYRTFDEKGSKNNYWLDISGKRARDEYQKTDVSWLGTLIRSRIKIGPTEIVNPIERDDDEEGCDCYDWGDYAYNSQSWAGDDVSFGWRLILLGNTYKHRPFKSFKMDSLSRISNFNEYAVSLDSLLTEPCIYGSDRDIYDWCYFTEDAVKNLYKHSKDDFLLKYHYSRCQFKDYRDGKFYRIVKMPDGKIWLAQNMNYKTEASWCYDEDDSNCEKYGRLYNWKSAKKACPSGWHLSTDDEWQSFIDNAGEEVGSALKGRKWEEYSAQDYFGFSALPGGMRTDKKGYFVFAGEIGSWWTSTENKKISKTSDYKTIKPNGLRHATLSYPIAYSRTVFRGDSVVNRNSMDKSHGFSVRCVKDE